MDYYEELGLDRTATEDEIRRAHRRLTKLLHPDQQTDDAVKQLAETQMRRLNAIVETLSDPQHRQEYDDELRRGLPGFQASKFRRRAFHSWPWWVGSTVGAIVLTVGAVWFSADKWGSSFGDRTPTYIPSGAETSAEPIANSTATEAPPSPATNSVPSAPGQQEMGKAQSSQPQTRPTNPASDAPATTAPSRTVASVPTPAPANKAQPEGSHPTVVVAEIPHRKILSLPLTHVSAVPRAANVNLPAAPALSTAGGVGHVETVSMPAANLPSAPTLSEPATAPATISKESSPAKPRDAVEGEWVYAPTEPEKRKAGFYPPEYIDLRIWNQGGLHGEYRARYHVTDKPIAPDVNFALTADGSPRRFTWESNNGSKGTLRISSIDAGSIRIEWRTTVFSHGLALTAGTATLVRRTP